MIILKKILVTGGAGFIGSNFIRYLLNEHEDIQIINLDILTYAGSITNLADIMDDKRHKFIHGSINDERLLANLFRNNIDYIVNFAAESHVDRSIQDSLIFTKTNILGTHVLLEVARKHGIKKFIQVSTDEVYGTLGESGLFTESTSYDPHSPYSASKASSDHFVRAYFDTYGLPVVLTNCSNNYGPNHFPEKLIPLCIHNILNGKPLPIYGDGKYTRDWLFVIDHAKAIDLVFHNGKEGDSYNVGGFNEWKNIDLVKELCKQMDQKLGREQGTAEQLITYVKDRPGHDLRYAIDANKINQELGYKPSVTFEEGLSLTIDWFLSNQTWLENVTSGDYQNYYNKQYSK